jgi:cytochrome P450
MHVGHPLASEVASYLRDPSTIADPYPLYRRLREREPVHWNEDLGYWVITGFREAESCLQDPRLSRKEAAARQFGWLLEENDPPATIRAMRAWLSIMLNQDPPDHARLRRLVSRAFTPRAVERWRGLVDQIVGELLAGVLPAGEFDFLHTIAEPLPEIVIATILGVPTEHRETWREFTGGMNTATVYSGRKLLAGEPPPGVRAGAHRSVTSWYEYFAALIEERRARPGDDLITALVQVEEQGDQLDEVELIGTLVLLIQGGQETTANLVANGMLAFMRHPDEFQRLVQDPALASAAVEECMRFDGPARGQPRFATDALEIGGQRIERGDQVMVIINAANRDPERFDNPERFDIARRPTGHIAFGAGPHYCLGAGLARLEATCAFQQLAESGMEFELTTEVLRYKNAHARNLVDLPVRVRRRQVQGSPGADGLSFQYGLVHYDAAEPVMLNPETNG